MQAFAEADRQFGAAEPPFHDPGHLVRDMVEAYLISAGDFVCGLQYVIAPDHGLTFSSASLARSAWELANKASWVAADGLTMGAADRSVGGHLEGSLQGREGPAR